MGAREGQDAIRTDGPFAWSDTPTPGRDLSDLAFGPCALFVATLVGMGFDALGMGTCVVIVYVVAVQVTALVTIRRLHCLLGSTLGVALYNYFFTSPRHSLTAVGAAYPGAFVVMFATALISSYAAMALRREVHRSHEAQRRSLPRRCPRCWTAAPTWGRPWSARWRRSSPAASTSPSTTRRPSLQTQEPPGAAPLRSPWWQECWPSTSTRRPSATTRPT